MERPGRNSRDGHDDQTKTRLLLLSVLTPSCIVTLPTKTNVDGRGYSLVFELSVNLRDVIFRKSPGRRKESKCGWPIKTARDPSG